MLEFKLPLPPMPEQERIVAEIEAEQRLVAGNRGLIERFEKKIQRTLARVSGEPMPAMVEPEPPIEMKSVVSDLFGGEDPAERYLQNAATVACLVIRKLGTGKGKTFVEKNFHVIESICDLPMGRDPRRMERGPADLAQHDRIMDWAANADAFLTDTTPDSKRVTYTRGSAFEVFVGDADGVLGDKRAAVEKLVGKLASLSSRQAEWVATAYGSWNDFIKDGVTTPSDAEIVQDIYTNWHPSKKDVREQDWRWAITWLRDNHIVPNGKGPRVEAV